MPSNVSPTSPPAEMPPTPRPQGETPADPDTVRACIDRIRELTRSKDERISLAASKELLDRLRGKPEQAHRLGAEGAGVVVVIREGRAGDAGHD